jgi:hypothetical protein
MHERLSGRHALLILGLWVLAAAVVLVAGHDPVATRRARSDEAA